MNKKIIISTILFIAVLIFSFFALSQEKNENQTPTNETTITENQSESQIILFYGDSCPHCVIVEEYIEENNIKEKIFFEQKEVYYNKNNANELAEKAGLCGLPTNSIGVPFLWNGEKCFVGDREIIEFFKQQSNKK
ncbi:MAG: hypothetical protein ISS87_01215 [Candidatus Pacebacteria bacterium]|nr:hypothetical protein [Candidatus Paceibacterota bacterium]